MIELVNPLKFTYNDGGREAAGYRGKTGDCVVRACAIITRRPYREVYQIFKSKNPYVRSRYGNGVAFPETDRYLRLYGFRWVDTQVEMGEVPRFLDTLLPKGPLVAKIDRHVSAVIDHVINDTFDAAGGGMYKPRLLGYWFVAI